MVKVWIVPDGSSARHTADGDYVIQERGERPSVLLGRVRGSHTEWLGDADPAVLPDEVRGLLTDSGAPAALDDPAIVRAVEGIASVHEHRGG